MTKNKKQTLHLIHGFIGSGKTTFAKKLEKEVNAFRFTIDEWRYILFGPKDDENFLENNEKLVKLIWKSAWRLLELEQDVIIDFGMWSREDRNETRAEAKEKNVNVKIYYTQCPKEIMLKRTLKRTENIPEDSMEISESTFNYLYKEFEPVSKDEEFILIKNWCESEK